MFLVETFIAAQESRNTTFDAPWLQKRKTDETMQNFYNMKTDNTRKKANELLKQFKTLVAPKSDE